MKRIKYSFIFCLIVLFLIGVQAKVHAYAIYSTFGSGYSYNQNIGWPVNSSVCETAASFTPASSYNLDSMKFALNSGYTTDQMAIYLAPDADSIPSYTWIESYSLTNISQEGGVYSVTSTSKPVLNAGQKYWVVLTVPAIQIDYSFGWFSNDQGITGRVLHRDPPTYDPYPGNTGATWWEWKDQGEYPKIPAFMVTGTPVPEPATILLLGFGLVGMAGLRRRFRR